MIVESCNGKHRQASPSHPNSCRDEGNLHLQAEWSAGMKRAENFIESQNALD